MSQTEENITVRDTQNRKKQQAITMQQACATGNHSLVNKRNTNLRSLKLLMFYTLNYAFLFKLL
jgi:hypothetical protein